MQIRQSLVKFLFLIAGSILCISCGRDKISTPGEYLAWLGNPKHGLVKSTSVNGVTLSMKYLPPEYRAYQELREEPSGKEIRDSVVHRCENSLVFLFSIRADTNAPGGSDIMMRGAQSYTDFEQRCMALNFGVKDAVELKAGGKSFKPVLAALDNDYGVSAVRNITLVFVDEAGGNQLLHSRTFDIAFNDGVFQTGITHFQFDSSDIAARAHLAF